MTSTQDLNPVQTTGFPHVGNNRNTDSDQSRATTIILERAYVDTVRHAGEVTRVFGFAEQFIFNDVDRRLKQENWPRRGLYIHYEYLPRLRGVANLIVAITKDSTRSAYLRILERLSKQPLTPIQGVFA